MKSLFIHLWYFENHEFLSVCRCKSKYNFFYYLSWQKKSKPLKSWRKNPIKWLFFNDPIIMLHMFFLTIKASGYDLKARLFRCSQVFYLFNLIIRSQYKNRIYTFYLFSRRPGNISMLKVSFVFFTLFAFFINLVNLQTAIIKLFVYYFLVCWTHLLSLLWPYVCELFLLSKQLKIEYFHEQKSK